MAYSPKVFKFRDILEGDCEYNIDEEGNYISPLSFEPFDDDEKIIRVSSGHCYSYDNIREWVNHKLNVDGIPTDPKTNNPLTASDLELIEMDEIVNSEQYLPTVMNYIYNNNSPRLRFLLDRGLDPNIGSGLPLVTAVKTGSHGIMLLLLNYGADPYILNGLPLLTAVKYSSHVKLELLLEHGVDPNYNNGKPLITAVNKSTIKIVELLIEYGANVNVRNGKALYEASRTNKINIVNLLLKEGADPNEPDFEPLLMATLKNNSAIVELLLDYGARPIATALNIATLYGYLDIFKLLVSKGADPTANNFHVYYLALQKGHQHIVDYLNTKWHSKIKRNRKLDRLSNLSPLQIKRERKLREKRSRRRINY